MKYKVGDYVKITSTRPKKPNISPSWVDKMDTFLGKTLCITAVTNLGYYACADWYFREEWLEDTLTLEERICNKIKELDNKWKERQLKCV